MTSLNRQDRDLHYEDGSHRSTPPTADGHQLDLWNKRLVRHLDRHESELIEVCCPECRSTIDRLRPDDMEFTAEELAQGFVFDDNPCKECLP